MSQEFPIYNRNLTIVGGEGVWLFDAAGRKYLDLYGGHAVACLGYGNAGLIECLTSAAENLFFQSNLVHLESRQAAIKALTAIVPGGPWSALLVNSGAEANENAIRLAFRTTGRMSITAVEGAFHGRTAAAAAVTYGSETWYGFPQSPFEVRWIPAGRPEAAAEMIDENTAAVIVEPVQGVAGARDLSQELLSAIQEAASQTGALVIADEVQCGMGRTGPVCAFKETPLQPDIVTLGKGIAGGFPAAAVLAKQSLTKEIKIGDYGTTFGGGPMAGALIKEVCDRIVHPAFQSHVRRIGKRLAEETVGKLIQRTSGKGLLIGLHTSKPAKEVQQPLLERGIIVGDSKDKHVVRLLPPLIIGDEHVDLLITALKEIGN